MSRNFLLGFLAIILGIMVMMFPLIGVFAASIIDGTTCVVLSLWLLIHSLRVWSENKKNRTIYILLALLGLVIGVLIIGNINVYVFFFGLTFYLAGLVLLIAGLLFIFFKENRYIGVLGVIMGVLSLVIGYLSRDPFFVAVIIGLFIIFYGIFLIVNN